MRNIKAKKYPLWRADIFFSKTKYNDICFLENGGWHFTNMKTPEKIDFKMKNFLHHLEYEESGLGIKDLKRIMAEKKVFYNHSADKSEKKWNVSLKLIKAHDEILPSYVKNNKEKFKEWID